VSKRTIVNILIFFALITLFASIFALATFVNIKQTGQALAPIFTDCSVDCIKTVGIASFILFAFIIVGIIFLFRNKNGSDDTDNGEWE
jgi:type II secretory pathway component PulF